MQIIEEKASNLQKIINALSGGGLVIFPCETVYGAAVDATNPLAVKKLSVYKQRPLGKPYSIMFPNQKEAEKYVELNDTAKKLYRQFLPGPVTIISKVKTGLTKNGLATGVASELGTVGVRIPNYKFLLQLLFKYGKPLTATSANASYKKRPYKIDDVLENVSGKQKQLIDLIIDAGELAHNEPSTVIDTTLDDPTVLRQGEVVFSDQNTILSRSEDETKNCGKELWQKYDKYLGQRAVVFALVGPMGVGKTQFTKGLAKAMGVVEEVVSPTFNLEISYSSPGLGASLDHFDAWRLQDGAELENLGLSGKIHDKSVLVVEWADRVADTIRKYNEEAVLVWVKLGYGKGENERTISWGVTS